MRPIIRCTPAEYLARVAAGERGAFDISRSVAAAYAEATIAGAIPECTKRGSDSATTLGAVAGKAPTHSHPGGSPRRVGGVESVDADSAPVFSK